MEVKEFFRKFKQVCKSKESCSTCDLEKWCYMRFHFLLDTDIDAIIGIVAPNEENPFKCPRCGHQLAAVDSLCVCNTKGEKV